MPVGNETLQATDTDRIAAESAGAGAFALAFLRADTTADSRQGTIDADGLISTFEIMFFNFGNKAFNIHTDRAFGNTGGIGTAQAALGLI